MPTIDKQLTLEFIDQVFEEMKGNQMIIDHVQNQSNSGINYKLGEDHNTVLLAQSKFTRKAVDFLVKRLDSNAPKQIKLQAMVAMLVGAIKFGMYLQRKTFSHGSLIE